MRRTIILAAALSIILLGLWGTAVIYFDEDRLKAIVSDRLSEQLGRRVEIVGQLRFSLFPSARIEAGGVIVERPAGVPGAATLRADRVELALRLAALLRGELSPGRMELSGAVIALAPEDTGGGDRSDPLEAIRSSAKLLAGRSVRLQDVTLARPSADREGMDHVSIDFVELERFSLDRPVAFRFRGDLGDPPLLEAVEIEGFLVVPASPDSAVRLGDMRLVGQLPGQDSTVSLSGDLSTRSGDPLRLVLSGGRLQVGSREFDISFNYRAGAPPTVDLLVSGAELDGASAARPLARRLNLDAGKLLAAVAQRIDLRSQLQFDRLRFGAILLANARVDVRSKSGSLMVSLSAAFPGGMVDANGVLAAGEAGSVAIDVSLAEFSQLLDALEWPAIAGGSGEARLVLHGPAAKASGFRLTGEANLWQGFWRVAGGGEEPVRREFDHFSTEIRLSPGLLELPAFIVQGNDLAGAGWAAVELDGGRLGGEFLASGGAAGRFDLSGTASQPRLAPAVPGDAESDPAERLEESP